MESRLNTEQGEERRPPCLGLLIACGDKNAWSNTFESMCENYYNDVNVGMREELLRHRCGIFTERIISVGNSVHQPVMLRHGLVDGVFIIGGMFQDGLLKMLRKRGIPAVVAGCSVPGVDCVTPDYVMGTYLAIQHLLEAGHRDILYINGPERTPTSAMKDRGYRQALNEYALRPLPKRFVRSEFSGEGGYWAAKTTFEINKLRPTAIYAACDTIVAGVMGYLYEQGLRVPDDVSVVSGERSMLTEHLTPVVTSVELNKKDVGVQAVRMMLRRLENPELPRQFKLVPVAMREGASVKTLDLEHICK